VKAIDTTSAWASSLLSFGRWEGVLALAGSALIFRTVFLLRRSVHG
jgi:hypothetical protein